jgi:hypothetical protein
MVRNAIHNAAESGDSVSLQQIINEGLLDINEEDEEEVASDKPISLVPLVSFFKLPTFIILVGSHR